MYKTGDLITEGKTKKIFNVVGHSDLVIVKSKDDITAGDGAKHDVLPGKGALSTQTTSCVFALLSSCGIPVAYQGREGEDSFLASKCEMIPLEIVMRRIVYGSYQKRNSFLSKGKRLPMPAFELFLKTTNKRFGDLELPWDDPLIGWYPESERIALMDPSTGSDANEVTLPYDALGNGFRWLDQAEIIVRKAFMALEAGWFTKSFLFLDCKFELGFDSTGRMVIADVLDNDSWRLTKGGVHYDKQCYRDGESLDVVLERFTVIADEAEKFELPLQVAKFLAA